MQIIDEKETKLWLSKKKLLDFKGEGLSLPEFLEPLSYNIPVDSGVKTALSRTITSFFKDDDESLLWINEFSIWPSAENQNLFYGFRRSLGESSQLYVKPGHLFSNGDIETIESLLSMVLYFYWGAILVPSHKNFIIQISHDEWMDVFVKDKNYLVGIQESLSKFKGLKIMRKR